MAGQAKRVLKGNKKLIYDSNSINIGPAVELTVSLNFRVEIRDNVKLRHVLAHFLLNLSAAWHGEFIVFNLICVLIYMYTTYTRQLMASVTYNISK